MRVPLLLRNYRPFGLSIVGAMLLTMGVGNLAIGATIPFAEDFSGAALDFGYSSSAATLTATVGSGVLTLDSTPATGGRSLNALVNISNANGLAIVMETDITPTVWHANGGGSSGGLLAYSTNPALGAFPGGPDSGYIADIVFPISTNQGFIRIFDNASVTTLVQSVEFAANSLLQNEPYHLLFTATPGIGGVLDLSLTITDTTGTLIDGDGIVTITASTPALASTGTFFGYRHRVGNSGATSSTRTFDAVYDNFSITAVPEPTAMVLFVIGAVGLVHVGAQSRKARNWEKVNAIE